MDLKSFTPENPRFKCFSQKHSESISHVTPPEHIKEDIVPEFTHSAVGVQTGHIEDKPENNLENQIKNNTENNSKEKMEIRVMLVTILDSYLIRFMLYKGMSNVVGAPKA